MRGDEDADAEKIDRQKKCERYIESLATDIERERHRIKNMEALALAIDAARQSGTFSVEEVDQVYAEVKKIADQITQLQSRLEAAISVYEGEVRGAQARQDRRQKILETHDAATNVLGDSPPLMQFFVEKYRVMETALDRACSRCMN